MLSLLICVAAADFYSHSMAESCWCQQRQRGEPLFTVSVWLFSCAYPMLPSAARGAAAGCWHMFILSADWGSGDTSEDSCFLLYS